MRPPVSIEFKSEARLLVDVAPECSWAFARPNTVHGGGDLRGRANHAPDLIAIPVAIHSERRAVMTLNDEVPQRLSDTTERRRPFVIV